MDPALEEIGCLEHQNGIIDLTMSPSLKDQPVNPNKLKRSQTSTANSRNRDMEKNRNDDEEDDGLTCPVCFEHWEMSGEHRLVSLKCGHIFGESCIRRWLAQTLSKNCPQCNSNVKNKDIRYLYAKRLRTIDRSEEHRLRKEIEAEKLKTTKLQDDLEISAKKLSKLKRKIRQLENIENFHKRKHF